MKSKKRSTLRARPRSLRYGWTLIYKATGNIYVEWFTTRAKAVAHAKKHRVLNLFICRVVLCGRDTMDVV